MQQKKNVDILFTYGKEAEFSADSARKAGLENVLVFSDKALLAERLLEILEEGDVVSFKASRGMRLEEVIKKIYEGLD